MKQTLIASVFALGLVLSSFSTTLAAGGNLTIAVLNPSVTRQLNPQPEPPGVTGQTESRGILQLNPQPEPPGVTEQKIIIHATTTPAACIKVATDAQKTANAQVKIAYNKAVQAAIQMKAKQMAYANTLKDKEPKKAAILKAQSDYTAAISKAQQDRATALTTAEQVYKRALAACRA